MSSFEMAVRHLECLKFIGWTKSGGREPAGEGVPVDILSLPDLLLDFREYEVACHSAKNVLAVGGRAARVATSLLNLTTDDDGLYRVYLATKTSMLGRMLLEAEYQNSPQARSCERDLLECLVLRARGELRCALRKDPRTHRGRPILARPALAGDELRGTDLAARPLRDLLRSARVTYFGSLAHEPYRALLPAVFAALAAGRGRRSLFLDASHADEIPAGYLAGLALGDRQAVTAVFVPHHAHRDLARQQDAATAEANPDLLALTGHIAMPTILYGGDKPPVYSTPSGEQVQLPADTPVLSLHEEGVSERFRAGVIVAQALRCALAEVVSCGDERYAALAQELLNEWGVADLSDIRCWQTILQCGVDVALLPPGEPAAGGSAQRPVAPPPDCYPPLAPTSQDSGRRRRRLDLATARGENLVELARVRRHLASHPELRATEPPRIAVMLDLDATLIDSSAQRARLVRAALAVLTAEGGPLNEVGQGVETDWEDLFGTCVYDAHALYKALGLGDFRQEWNHEGWYATLLALADGEAGASLREHVRRFVAPGSGSTPARLAALQIGTPREPAWLKSFRQAYQDALRRHGAIIDAARRAFWAARIAPLKEARDLLRSLSVDGRFALYVVSEGDPEAQWRKIRSAGLDEFVSEDRMLTTGDAARPASEQTRIDREAARLNAEISSCQEQQQRAGQAVAAFLSGAELPLRQSIETARRQMGKWRCEREQGCPLQKVPASALSVVERFKDEYVEELARLGERLDLLKRYQRALDTVGKVLSSMEQKRQLTFYAAAVRAIRRNPLSPRDCLTSLDALLAPAATDAGMRMVMLGDRQDNDIEPPIILLDSEHVLTIRLLSGRYAKRDEGGNPAQHLAPHYEAETLAQAKALLLTLDWQKLDPAPDPPIYNCEVRAEALIVPPTDPHAQTPVSFAVLVDGIAMQREGYEISPRLCAGMLAEYLGRSHTDVPEWWSEFCQASEWDDAERCEAREMVRTALLAEGHSELAGQIAQAVDPANG